MMKQIPLFIGFYLALAASVSAQKDDVLPYLAKAEQGDRYAIQMVTRGYYLHRYYAEAAVWAERGSRLGCGYCKFYYAKALVDGRGVQKDERAGFRLMAEMLPGSAIDLAELYEKGIGTPRDPIEAYSLAIAASYYNCQECEDMHASADKLVARLRQELTADQINIALERAYARDPNLKSEMWWALVIGLGVIVFSLLMAALLLSIIASPGIAIFLIIRALVSRRA